MRYGFVWALSVVAAACGGETSSAGGTGGMGAAAGSAGSGAVSGAGGAGAASAGGAAFTGGTGATGGVGGSGTGGIAGGCSPDGGTGVTVSGYLSRYALPTFDKTPFTGKAIVTMEGVSCPWIVAHYDGSVAAPKEFVLHDVWKSGQSWMHLYDEAKPPLDVLPTLLPVHTQSDVDLGSEAGFVSKSEIDAAHAAVGIPRDPQRATVVVQAVDMMTGTPVAGATIKIPTAQSHAFASSSGWAPSGPTDDSGLALALNVPSQSFPGTNASVLVTTSSSTSQYEVRVESGAVSVAWIGIGY